MSKLMSAGLAFGVAGLSALSATDVQALTEADNVSSFGEIGSCFVQRFAASSTSTAAVTVYGPSIQGGSAFAGDAVFGDSGNSVVLTSQHIAGCLGTDPSNILSFDSNGADGAYIDDNYLGFIFTLAEPAGGLSAGPHEYKVGSSSFPVADTTPPEVTIGALSGPDGSGNYTAQITLSEPSADFTVADLTLTNATATMTGSGTSYTVTLTPQADGFLALNVLADVFTDEAGNGNTAGVEVGATYDGTSPTVTIAPLSGPVDGAFTTTITLSEPSDDFVLADLNLTNATATMTGSGTSYTVTLTPGGDGLVALNVLAGVFTDAAGNANAAGTEVSATFDGIAPTVVLSGAPAVYTANEPFEVAIVFDEAVSGLSAEDLTVENAVVVSLTGSGASYTATINPSGAGDVAISIPAASAVDDGGNNNLASNVITVASPAVDSAPPAVVISGAPASFVAGQPFQVAIAFAEAVTGFVAGDVTVTNGTVTGLTGSGASYTATITPSGAGDVAISVPAAAANDLAGNASLASNAVTVLGNSVVAATQGVIAGFVQARANHLVNEQPDLIPLLDESNSGEFSADVTRGNGNLSFATAAGTPVWLKLTAAWSETGNAKNRYAFGAMGTHSYVSPNAIVGVMLQFDHLDQTDAASSTKGTGWLVGPYFVAKSADQPLYFEGRLLYGQTSNSVSPFGTHTDSFSSERMLARLKIAGELSYGTTKLQPNLLATYTDDNQKAYTDSLGNLIPSANYALGQIEAGMDFATPIATDLGELTLTGGLSGIYAHSSGAGPLASNIDGTRAKVKLGVN